MTPLVRLEPPPDVEVLGTAVLIRGATALDVYRVLGEGINTVRTRDGINAPPRLMQALAAFKIARTAVLAEQQRSDAADIPDVREPAGRPKSAAGEQIGIVEVAQLCGVGDRQARRLAPSLGGRKRHNRWQFDRALVEAYLHNTTERRDDHAVT